MVLEVIIDNHMNVLATKRVEISRHLGLAVRCLNHFEGVINSGSVSFKRINSATTA